MKHIIILSLFLISNCATIDPVLQKNESFQISNNEGCSSIQIVKDRLSCIGKLVKELEEIKNSRITIKKEQVNREDEKYVKYKYTYCFTDKERNKLFCFDILKSEYDPTLLGKIYNFSIKFGLGFLVGITTGIVSLN